MRQIAIDIETFSPAPLAKTGVYPYAEHPDFRLLIFGYSIDGGSVEVVDLASGGHANEFLLIDFVLSLVQLADKQQIRRLFRGFCRRIAW